MKSFKVTIYLSSKQETTTTLDMKSIIDDALYDGLDVSIEEVHEVIVEEVKDENR